MEYNIDEYKVNNNKLFLNGWVHEDNYKLIAIVNDEEKTIKKYQSRYDICMKYHEKIEDNHYGFKEELIFKSKVKYAKIYIEKNNTRDLIYIVDERKIILFLKKIKKFLGKIKRGIRFLWKEYHFIVPPTMLKKYIKMVLTGNKHQQTIYNPEIISEYKMWYDSTNYSKDITTKNDKLHFLNIESKNFQKELAKVKEKYICIQNGKIEMVDYFFQTIDSYLKEEYDLIYFDNDFKKDSVYCNPIFKPDFSPDTLLGVNYIGNCFIIKRTILQKIMETKKKESIYSILLYFREKKQKIKHISKILYHDLGIVTNGKKEVMEYLKDNKIKANVKTNPDKITNIVEYIPTGKSLVSIIIPTKDHADILKTCLESIYQKTTYKKFEIIVIDNNSCEKETFDLLKEYKKQHNNFKYKRIECEFNYSYLNNEAAKIATGDYLLLLNNDIEVITPEWLERMLGYAEQNHVGTVGAKLIFPDETIQHAGIIMGKGGLAGHAHYSKPRTYISPQYELKVPYNYSACTAACLLIDKKKFEEVNGLEEKLKVAFNDVDFNLKILKKGYYNVFLPNVELYHYESKSRGLDTSPEKQKRFIQEWSLIVEKWSDIIKHDPFYNDNFSKNEDYMLKEVEKDL